MTTIALLPASDRQSKGTNLPAYAMFSKSPMFRLQWQYVRQVLNLSNDQIFILSYNPAYYVLGPMEGLANFDIHITAAERLRWGTEVVPELRTRCSYDVDEIISFMSQKQMAALVEPLHKYWGPDIRVTCPLRGRGIIGMQMSVLKKAIESSIKIEPLEQEVNPQ